MTQRILIMGLPGAGKTTLATELKTLLDAKYKVVWLNADRVRKEYDDWDFSEEGRIRQSKRMYDLSTKLDSDFVIADFVAPLVDMRNNFKADWTIWVDTIKESRYEDTNKAFIEPDVYDFRVTEQDAVKWAEFIADHIINNRRRPVFDWKKETVQMLGRWQPWHDGHRALFERLLQRNGQVIIQVRDVQGWQGSNPFAIDQVKRYIRRDLDPMYQGLYEIQVVPNIVHIGWGRGVGYTSGEEKFDESITRISATDIRKDLEERGLLNSLNYSRDSTIRSLVKAISWRITGTIDTFIVSWFVTGEPLIASGIACTEVFTKVFLFWIHERGWNKINWGRNGRNN